MGNRVAWSKKFPIVLGAVLASCLGGIGGALAQAKIPEGLLTGAAAVDPSGSSGATGLVTGVHISTRTGDLPTEPLETKLTRMPAHTAFRGLADSKQYKEMFKGMITSEVPVMFQTMMMVENGAATGFMGSLQSVSNMLDSSIHAANLELAMRRVHGPEAEKQFVNAVYDGLARQENGRVDHLWPVGLYYASGDQITEQLDEKYKLQRPYTRNQSGGASMTQHLDADRRPNGEDGSNLSLAGIIFRDVGTSMAASGGEGDQAQYMEYIKNYIGDIEFSREQQPKDNPTVIIKATYKKPTASAQVTNRTQAPTGPREGAFPVPDTVYGLNVVYDEVRKKTWEDMYQLLRGYCNFKKNNENRGVEIFNKDFVYTAIQPGYGNLIGQVSSPNFKVSLNLIDQVFKIWVQTTTDSTQPTKIVCDFENAEQEMPENAEPNSDGAGDSCIGAEKAKKCRRNKWLYRLVDIIALDKVIEQAKDTYEAAMVNALTIDPSTAGWVNKLFCNSLVANSGSDTHDNQCNIGFWFDSMAGFNRQRWSDQLESTAKLAQSLGGSSNFRFQPNNSLSVAGGSPDPDGDTGGGGGGGGGGGVGGGGGGGGGAGG